MPWIVAFIVIGLAAKWAMNTPFRFIPGKFNFGDRVQTARQFVGDPTVKGEIIGNKLNDDGSLTYRIKVDGLENSLSNVIERKESTIILISRKGFLS